MCIEIIIYATITIHHFSYLYSQINTTQCLTGNSLSTAMLRDAKIGDIKNKLEFCTKKKKILTEQTVMQAKTYLSKRKHGRQRQQVL